MYSTIIMLLFKLFKKTLKFLYFQAHNAHGFSAVSRLVVSLIEGKS